MASAILDVTTGKADDLPSRSIDDSHGQAEAFGNRVQGLAPLTSKSGRLMVMTKSGSMRGAAATTRTSRLRALLDDEKVDWCLAKYAPAAKLLLMLTFYYGVAIVFYTNCCTKPCESSHALNRVDHDASNDAEQAANCRESWTIIDAIYFTTVSMSTVGYGDLTVSDPCMYTLVHPLMCMACVWHVYGMCMACTQVGYGDLTVSDVGPRLFTMVWILVGIAVVFVQCAVVFAGLFDFVGHLIQAAIDLIGNTGAARVASEAAVASPRRKQQAASSYWYYASELLVYLGVFCVMQALVGVVIMTTEHHFTFFDTVWYCFVTSTTVGYGDVNVLSQVCAWHARTCTPCMRAHVHPADPCMPGALAGRPLLCGVARRALGHLAR